MGSGQTRHDLGKNDRNSEVGPEYRLVRVAAGELCRVWVVLGVNLLCRLNTYLPQVLKRSGSDKVIINTQALKVTWKRHS
jgi:hypothetical protein